MITFALNLGTIFSAFAAAVFWFISAAGKIPRVDVTYAGFFDVPGEIISSLTYSARWNRLAAIFSGVSALFLAAATAWSTYCKPV